MTRTYVRTVLFFSSYSPLMVILAIRVVGESLWAGIALLAVGVASVYFLRAFLAMASRLDPEQHDLQTASSLAGDSMSYLFTYVVPFLAVDWSDPFSYGSLGVFLFIVALIYVRSNMVYVNPLLNLMGYQTFRVETGDGREFALITGRDHIPAGTSLRAVRVGYQVLFERG